MIFGPLTALTLGGLLIASFDQPPTLNIAPTCASADRDFSPDIKLRQCERIEEEARNTLAADWTKFSVADRRDCLAVTKIGGVPSYVQVLTCLEIARDARRARGD